MLLLEPTTGRQFDIPSIYVLLFLRVDNGLTRRILHFLERLFYGNIHALITVHHSYNYIHCMRPKYS